MSGDEITLQLPRERPFFRVAHLVIGGLAVRLDLSYDELEDLQVALEELLGQRETEDDITLTVRVDEGVLHAFIGPFDGTLIEALARAGDQSVGLRRVLETVADDVEVEERSGSPWVALTKRIRQDGDAR